MPLKWAKNLPIRQQLTLMILVLCALALVLACVALGLYERHDFRATAQRDAAVLAKILGTNAQAALTFNDAEAATALLRSLEAESDILAARLYDRSGAPFADYIRAGDAATFPGAPKGDSDLFIDGLLEVFRAVDLDGKQVGTMLLQVDLSRMRQRLALFAGVAGLVLAAALVIALILSGRIQRLITGPILALAEVAGTIAQRRDYSVRAPAVGGNELGQLTDAFNHMLTQIHASEVKLQSQLAKLDLLNQITRAIGQRQDLPSMFQVVIRSLEDKLPIDFSCVCLYDAVADRLMVVNVGARSEALAMELGMAPKNIIPIDENGLSRCVRGQLVHEPDITEVNFPFPQRLAKGGMKSMVAAPMLVESKVFGVFVVASKAARSFTSADCEFLRQLSEHVALAAHQSQLYNALQQAYDDLRTTQQAVMQQERLRALGQMASGIAHDINNAISPVALYTEALLERDPSLSEKARGYLEIIKRAIDDVAHTVARMREFYRQREPQLTLTTVNLNQMVEQVLDLTRVRWSDMPQQRGIVIATKTEFAADLPAIHGVESEIREALINLVFNAIDAMPSGGTLTLRTKMLAGSPGNGTAPHAVVEVCDTGIGMTEETRRRCTEPFFTTKGERGTGLGLAMVYGMVQRHSAEIEIESALNLGTKVRLRFPVPTSAQEQALSGESAAVPSRLRILVVDDDPLLLKSLSDILESDGHLVTVANGGQAGIDAFKTALSGKDAFEAVITDLGMPYVDGRKVSATVKMASPETPVILLTGWGQRLVTEGEVPPHVDCVLNKPPKIKDLRDALARHCRPRKS